MRNAVDMTASKKIADRSSVNIQEWKNEFKRLCNKYISKVDWNTVVMNEGDIEQIADDLQADAYRNIFCGEECNPSVADWDFYEESCEHRTDFQYELKERWESVLEDRQD